MTSTATRTPPPDLEFRAPDCPICDTETDADPDGFRCENCGASWERDGRRGEWDDMDAPQCESTIKPYDPVTAAEIAHIEYRCIHEDGHDGKHAHPEYLDWTDASPHLTAPPKRTTGLVTIECGPSIMEGPLRLPGSIHLVREEGAANKEVLCGIDRFRKHGPGWSIGGGTIPTDSYACSRCRDRAHDLYADFPIRGMHRDMFTKAAVDA